ncbi:MAG: sulfatase-like hydrolase/transferase, partial [Actinomycetota bacterium]
MPRNVVVLLLDSLNRHEIGAYGGRNFDTPNIDRLARRSIRFTNHHTGSLPCIPARHDILVGAWDFLWKPWGSIELWEEPITASLRRAGVVTQLVTDHPHLFEVGGENYHTDFTAWAYERGHESDPWCTRPDESWLGAPSYGRGHTHYDNSRGWFRGEQDFPGPRTMSIAAHWLSTHAPVHRAKGERFMLFVDEFDPHEPFDTPEEWATRYDDSWEGPHLIWPPYAVDAFEKGIIDERDARQIRAQYGGTLARIDPWLGRGLGARVEPGAGGESGGLLGADHGRDRG